MTKWMVVACCAGAYIIGIIIGRLTTRWRLIVAADMIIKSAEMLAKVEELDAKIRRGADEKFQRERCIIRKDDSTQN